MRRLTLLSLAFCSLNCYAQTNSSAQCGLFAIPSLDLRVSPSATQPLGENQKTSGDTPRLSLSQPLAGTASSLESPNSSVLTPKHPALSISLQSSEEVVHDSFRTDFDRALYQRLDRAGYFTRLPPSSEKALDRVVDNIFNPEVFRMGKTSVSCSILTAIKRKNPLCLANPIFLNISW